MCIVQKHEKIHFHLDLGGSVYESSYWKLFTFKSNDKMNQNGEL